MTSHKHLLHQPIATAVSGVAVSVGLLLAGAGTAVAAPQAATKAESRPVPSEQTSPVDSSARFGCQLVNGEYLVMYYPQSQPGQSYPWAKPSAMGGGWTPERRCNEISRRLEFYRPDGLLEMQTSVENGYDIVCVTTDRDPSCRIVLTVPRGQDPLATRDRVFENLTVADSGQQTDAVNTFVGNDAGQLIQQIGEALNIDLPVLPGRRQRSRSLDLRPFLDRTDGGTGTRLRRSAASQRSPRLYPESLR